MTRAPFNVLVVPFLRPADADVLYCVLRRSDAGWWQWVAGGGENEESPVEAACRETMEEIGISGPLFALSSQARVPVSAFSDRSAWPADLYVIPEHHFALEASSREIRLSREHSELRWLPYDEAFALLRWQSNQTALWELAQRLHNNDLRLAEE